MESAHRRELFTYHGPLNHIDHTHRQRHTVSTGRGDGSYSDNDGSLASIPEDYWRRQQTDGSLVSNVEYGIHKRSVLIQLQDFAKSMQIKSEHIRREIEHLAEEIAGESEAVRKLNVEINRRRAAGSWTLL